MYNPKVKQFFKKKAGSGIDRPGNASNGNNPLHNAVNELKIAHVLDLINKGANINQPNYEGNTPLHLAVAKKDNELIKILLENGADVNVKNGSEETAFFNAVSKGINSKTISLMIDFDADTNSSNKVEKTVLHFAAEKGNAKIVDMLVKNGADVNAKNNTGVTPAHLASQKGNIDSLNILVENLANLDVKNKQLETPLHLAAKENHIEIVKLLLSDKEVQKKINKNVTMKDGENAAVYAIKKNNVEITEMLLEYGVEPNRQDNNGRQLLYHAAMNDCFEIAEKLIDKGADVRKATIDKKTKKTLMHHAVLKNNVKLVGLLYDNNAHVDLIDQSDNTPLSIAIEYSKDHRIISALITAGSNIDRMDSLGNRPIDIVCSNYSMGENRQKILSSILSKKPNLNLSDSDLVEAPPLQMLIDKGHKQAIPQLIEAGANIHEVDKIYGYTTFLSACVKGNLEILELLFDSDNKPNIKDVDFNGRNAIQVYGDANHHTMALKKGLEYLIDKGVEIEHRDNEGVTPLLNAARKNHVKMFNFLLEKEANILSVDDNGNNIIHQSMCAASEEIHVKAFEYKDKLGVNTPNKQGMSPLHIAVKSNKPKNVKALLQFEDIEVNVENLNGQTPLELATISGNSTSLEALIDSGAEVNLNIDNGQTLMHLAASINSKNNIEKLMNLGLDINKQDNDGNTPLHIASILGRNNIIEFLLRNGAKEDIPNNEGKIPLQIAVESKRNISIKKFKEFYDNKDEILENLKIKQMNKANKPNNPKI